jgi:cytochrome c oxidase accessory protein FixG
MSTAVEAPEFIPRPIRLGERLHPRVVKGRFFRVRRTVAWAMIGAFLAAPWVHVDGHPLFLFQWLERRFVVFGVPFFPQDFHLVALGLVTFIVFVSVFTALFGRVWCGWACPQTVFLEMVFRPVEALFEGNPNARRRLDAAPWGTDKFLRKGGKHAVFALIAFGVGLTGLAYVVGRDEALGALRAPFTNAGTLAVLLMFSAAFYGVFAHLREVACVVICPYGRLQSVLTDRQTLTVAYDFVRGEPRGKAPKPPKGAFALPHTSTEKAPFGGLGAAQGDCVDCHLCVQVCPTGIDIRNGANQLECVGCTACIDACNYVMDQTQRPRGLIRYASLDGIERNAAQQGTPWRVTRRVVAYIGVLLSLLGGLGYLRLTRQPVETTLLRAPGQLHQTLPDGRVSNLYTIEILNKTFNPATYQLRPAWPGLTVRLVGQPLQAAAGELAKASFFLEASPTARRQPTELVDLELLHDGRVIDRLRTTFLRPAISSSQP